MMRRASMSRIAVLVGVAFVPVAACTKDNGGTPTVPTSAASTTPGTVNIQGTAYNPAKLGVKAGDQVTWSFNDNGLNHSVTADDSTFDSGVRTNGTFNHAFRSPGTVTYHCVIHVRMHGMVTVTP